MKAKRVKNEFSRIIPGIILLLGLHIVVVVSLGILAYIVRKFNTILAADIILSLFYIGLLQLIYVIPVVILLKRKKREGKMKGVVIGAIITAFLNIVLLVSWLFSFR